MVQRLLIHIGVIICIISTMMALPYLVAVLVEDMVEEANIGRSEQFCLDKTLCMKQNRGTLKGQNTFLSLSPPRPQLCGPLERGAGGAIFTLI